MELKEQLTNLELSKKMKELGFDQSLFIGSCYFSNLPRDNRQEKVKTISSNSRLVEARKSKKGYIKAYTVAELGEMLPIKSSTHRNFKDAYVCEVENIEEYQVAKTEANARAKMLIYLKEKKFI